MGRLEADIKRFSRIAIDTNAFISTFPNLGLREIDQNIAHLAAKLRARYGFKTPDALFLATALEEKAEAFITNDVRLKGIENIEIVLISSFVD